MERSRAVVKAVTAMAMAGLGVVWLGGCAATAAKHDYSLEIPPDTTLLAVDIENFKGSVEVRADKRTPPGEAVVRSEVLAPSGAKKPELERVKGDVGVDATIEDDEGRGVLRIRTDDAQKRGAEWVKLYVEVPRCDGLRIVNHGGDVEVVGTGGTTHIENHQGAIELRTSRVMDEDVTLLGVDGNIYYQVPPGSKGEFDLKTLNGQVAMRDFTGMTKDTQSTKTVLRTTLSKGTNKVVARTNKGDIRVWVMEDPEALTRMIKKSPPDLSKMLFQEGSRRYMRNLPADEPKRHGTRSNPGG